MNTIQYPFRTDHDVLIAVIEDVNQSIASLDRRMLEDHGDTLEIKGLLQEQYTLLSQKINSLETQLNEINPKEIAMLKDDVRRSKEWINNFNMTKHVAWIAASVGFGVIGYSLQYVFYLLKIVRPGGF